MMAQKLLQRNCQLHQMSKYRSFSITAAKKIMCQDDGIIEKPYIRHPFTYNPKLKSQLLQIDYENSKGNFVVDGNGNILLDLFQNDGTLPLGFNHKSLINSIDSNSLTTSFLHVDSEAPAIPSDVYIELLEKTLLALAPTNLTCVRTTLGDPLVETLHTAVGKFKENMLQQWDKNYRGLNSNLDIFSKHFTIMAFEGSPCTQERCPYHVQAIKFPKINHPFDENLQKNRLQESECLENLVNIVKSSAGRMQHAAALLVDPNLFSFEMASPEFYNCLRMICTELNIMFIVNEMDTGLGATGTIWAHDKWNLSKPPDAVVFGKKMMASGFYFNTDFETNQSSSLVSGPVCDPTNLMLLDAVLQTISNDNLFQTVNQSASEMRKLKKFKDLYPSLIESINSDGILGSIIFTDSFVRQQAELLLLNSGVHLGKVSDRALILRPALILTKDHVAYFSQIFDQTCKSLDELLQRNGRTISA